MDGYFGTLLTIHGAHDESDLGGVGSACEVSVDLLGLCLVQGNESVQDVIASSSIVWTSYKIIRDDQQSRHVSNVPS